MAVKVLIVEDEVLVAENLAEDLKDFGFDVTGIAISSDECFAELDKAIPDIVLMDIQIQGDLSGIEVARQIDPAIGVIFLTSNTDPYSMNLALETKPSSFMSKPYSLPDLKAAIEIAFKNLNEDTQEVETVDSVFVKSGTYYHRVRVEDITYVEAAGSYCTVFTSENEYVLSMNLQGFFGKLPSSEFARIHRSFVVNLKQIMKLDHHSVVVNNKSLPISKSFREELFQRLNRI